ncbi:LysR family transcriptional regulator [Lysinibacillus sp. 54212]|uniref:LysR family transcriptional regulator n=1 Tax=Lysinibacillus sp. 54212 TaxID=3119829 RepID=UPI002FCB03E4
MDIDALKAFKYVAELGSISQAAERLNYSQSNITAKIHKLEEQLQTKILFRHNRGCIVTPKGEELLQYALQIFKTIERAQSAMQDQENPVGTLKIGSMETTAAIRLPKILAAYNQQYSKVDLSLRTNPTLNLIDSVLHFELDAAFVSGPIQHSSLDVETIFQEKMLLIYPKKNEFIPLESSTILVFRSGCSYRFQLEKYLRHKSIKSYRLMELGSLEAILGCVAAGLGITLLPEAVYNTYSRYYELSYDTLPNEFSIIDTQLISQKENPSVPLFHFKQLLKRISAGAIESF